MEPLSLKRLEFVHPAVSERVVRAAHTTEERHGIAIRITEGLRSWEYQEKLYSRGRRKDEFGQWERVPGEKIVTKVKPGFSTHNFGLAADICFLAQGDPYLERRKNGRSVWETWGREVQRQGLVWGGDWDSDGDMRDQTFHDWPHAQGMFGLTMNQCRQLFDAGGLRFVWTEIDRLVGDEPGVRWETQMRQLDSFGRR